MTEKNKIKAEWTPISNSGEEYGCTPEDTEAEDICYPQPQHPILKAKMEDNWTNGYTQWMIEGDRFIPIQKTVNKIPSGFYNFTWNSRMQMYVLKKQDVNTEQLLIFPDTIYSDVLTDIHRFWNSKEVYNNYDYLYKRGILLYGKPGCGKSSLIMLLAKELIEKYDGVIFNLRHSGDIECFNDVMGDFREIEPDRSIIVVIEDIDNFTINNNNQELVTTLLNILDGASQLTNVVTIATTNHPEKLEERIANRPSRFDRRYEIGPPNAENREYYLKNKLKDEDLKEINIDRFIKKTEGFTIDHLKELVLSIYVLGYDQEQAFSEISNMYKSKVLKNSNGDNIGFKK